MPAGVGTDVEKSPGDASVSDVIGKVEDEPGERSAGSMVGEVADSDDDGNSLVGEAEDGVLCNTLGRIETPD
jgi:hypothetical protein